MSDVDCFHQLERGLQDLGLVEDAQWMQRARTCPYTTSSEMYGELGEAIRRIYRSIPRESVVSLRHVFSDCEHSVRRAWPGFTLAPDAW